MQQSRPSTGTRTSFLTLTVCLCLCGCRVSPLALRTSVFAKAATATTQDTQNAYGLLEDTYRDAQVARLVENYDSSGFDPAKLKPFLPEHDLEVRTLILDGLRSYATLLAAVSSDQSLTDVDLGAKALGQSLQAISSEQLVAAKFTATNAKLATTAIGALGHALIEQRRRRELPSILRKMQEPVQTICSLLEQDIGDPEHSGIRNQLHISYLDLIREQKNFISENESKLTPAEKRDEIRALPRLAKSELDTDRALAKTQQALAQLALTHTALAATSGHKYAPAFDLQMQQLASIAGQLQSFYASTQLKS